MEKNERVVRCTAEEMKEMVRRGESQTDWDRVRALTDEEIEASIDFEDEGRFDFSTAVPGLPPEVREALGPPQPVIPIDAGVVSWFQTQGPDYLTRINMVLRDYVDGEKRKAS